MIGRLFHTAAIVSIASMLAVGGFCAYLVGIGKLTSQRVDQIAAVLRGEMDADPNEAAAAPAEAADDETADADEVVRGSADQARERRRREGLETLRLERAAADLAAQREMLERLRLSVVNEQEALEKAREKFAAARQQRQEDLRDVGFQKELRLVTGLSPKQAKEHIIASWRKHKADAVRLMMAMDQRQAKRILDQMRSAEEQRVMSELLEEIRLQGTARADVKDD